MSNNKPYFRFSGHAIGAAARFHRLDPLTNLNHVVPTLGHSVLPVTGGHSESHAEPYRYEVDEPSHRVLLAVQKVDTFTKGRTTDSKYETEIETDTLGLNVLEKLRVDRVKLHLLSTRDANSTGCESVVSTNGSLIEGMTLGQVQAKIVLDEEPITFSGSQDQLATFYRGRSAAWRTANAFRFGLDPSVAELPTNGHHSFSLVREIQLSGTQDPDHPVTVDGYTIIWEGFGRIILGEVFVKGCDRRVTMLRLAMGSDAGGDGSIGDGGSNGQTGGN
jgi:hypothetical protein